MVSAGLRFRLSSAFWVLCRACGLAHVISWPRGGCEAVLCLCHMPRLCLALVRRRGVSSACAGSHWVCSCGKGFLAHDPPLQK